MLKKAIISCCSILLLTACQKEDGLHQFHHVDVEGWDRNDTIAFDVPASSEEKDYDLQLNVRITQNYAFRDLWLVVEHTYMQKEEENNRPKTSLEIKREQAEHPATSAEQDSTQQALLTKHSYIDTLHIELTDSSDAFNGQGRNLLEYKVPVRFFRLQRNERGEIRIHHIMDDKSITHIHDIGVDLTPVEKNNE